MSVAIQLLQCKPDSFVSPKLSSLPIEMQSKVATYMRLDTNSHSDSEGSTSGVGVATASSYHVLPASDSPPPMCPFPPTAMVYSMRGIDGKQPTSPQDGGGGGGAEAGVVGNGTGIRLQSQQKDSQLGLGLGLGSLAGGMDSLLGSSSRDHGVVSPSVMAKFLEDELKSSEALLNSPVKHCETCVCPGVGNRCASGLLVDMLGDDQKYYNVGTQTVIKGETNNSLCLRCNNNLNSPSHNNSPYLMKLIKSSDSVISETKSSVSDFLTTPEKTSPNAGSSSNQASCKKDDIMVNPILGHHRLSERTTSYQLTQSPNSDAPQLTKPSNLTLNSKSTLPNPTILNRPTPTSSNILARKPSLEVNSKPKNPSLNPTTTTGLPSNTKLQTNDSPSYIIKDTDQMSGSAAGQTPRSTVGTVSIGGTQQQIGGGHGTGSSKIAGGSVGSGLYHAVGSTNSLWSRTSSSGRGADRSVGAERDGARIFEAFNRNLIKTIKAENPKMSGPRICSLRIQNGSSNILLDSLQDELLDNLAMEETPDKQPVVYTRRSKFLDEELLLDDDPSIGLNGAIKTTNLPTVGVNEGGVGGDKSGVATGGSGEERGEAATRKDICSMSTTTSPNSSSDRVRTAGEEVNNLLFNNDIGQQVAPVVGKPRLDINVNKLEGIDINSKKSCTQSSSISSEIDIQESAMLRRQQLSRVAEWVQNNSKLTNPDGLSNTESDTEATTGNIALVDSLNNNNSNCSALLIEHNNGTVRETKLIASDTKLSHSVNNTSQLQTHSDNLLSNSNSINNNHIISNSNNNIFAQTNIAATQRMHTSSLKTTSIGNTTQLDFNSNSSHPANFQAINNANNKSRSSTYHVSSWHQHPENISATESLPHHGPLQIEGGGVEEDDRNSVDIAQMEYNVKQFLLKQNEWSSIGRRLSSSTTSGTVANEPQTQPQSKAVVDETTVSSSSTSTMKRIKGSFPGTAVAQMPQQFHLSKYTVNPHRTETNL
ncbi:hybrid signal transduction histidine kinase A-like [Uranotaenia lowii]|uniref:hybrid signal transduction histidine kinase A-like n=1 Tax=Uranotaenia lowii TaxID=190385 RepID=UPI002479BAF3|nr:hybrid signal transduction histidine kinase A-like [Uranotaenia lowii]